MSPIDIKNQIKEQRGNILHNFLEGHIDVKQSMAQQTELMDRQVSTLADAHLHEFKGQSAVIFTGSSGRGELCPLSDNDLFLLISEELLDSTNPSGVNEEFGKALSDFNMALSDTGIGQVTIRTVSETIDAAFHDPNQKDGETYTQLLDMRFSQWGNKNLYTELEDALQKVPDDLRIAYIGEKFDTYDARINLPINTAAGEYSNGKNTRGRITLIEPNIKNGYGSLRGQQTVNWVKKAFSSLHDEDSKQQFTEQSKQLLPEHELKSADDAYHFLLEVRHHLHALLNNEDDVLRTDKQQKIAQSMGYDKPEDLMHDYFKANNQIAYVAKISCAIIAEQLDIKPPGDREKSHVTCHHDITNPMEMLELFRTSQKEDKDLHYTALSQIRKNINMIDGDFRDNAKANALFMDIVTDPAAERVLRRMQKIGLLQEFLPPFKDIDSLALNDPAHAYTVDEHQLIGIGHIHSLRSGEHSKEAPTSTKVTQSLSEKDLRTVCFAALLHDTGKGQSGNKNENGAKITREMANRFNLTDRETEDAAWLVDKSTFLYNKSRLLYRDDPKTTQRLVEEIKNTKRLDMLMAFTVADMMAAGPGRRWDPLRKSRLEDLHEHAKDSIRGLQLPREYKLGNDFIEVAQTPQAEASIVSVITLDKPYLFSNLTGALAKKGCDIRDVRSVPFIDDEGNDAISSSFTVLSSSGTAIEEWDEQSICKEIEKTIKADDLIEYDFPQRLSKSIQENNQIFEFEPFVDISNETVEDGTIIEVKANDRPGLLYDIARSLNEIESLRLDVIFCHSATSPGIILDTIMIQHEKSNVPKEHFDEIRKAILDNISAPPEVG